MIYIVLNVILCAVLVWFSSFEDVRNDDERIKPVINFVLLLAAIAFFTAANVLVSMIGNKQLISVVGKVTLAFFAWFSISISFYLLSFPKIRKGVVTKVIKIALLLGGIYVILAKIQEITVSIENGIQISSEEFPYFAYSWAEIFFFVFAFVLPGLAEFSILLRVQREKNKLFRQKLILLFIALPAAVGATYVLCRIATNIVPSFNLLYVFGLAALIFLVYKAVSMSVLVDITIIASRAIDFIFNYIIISIIAGILFAVLQPLRFSNVFLFVVVYGLVTAALLVLAYQGTKYLRKLRNTRDANYSHHFEEELSMLDYTESPDTLNEKLARIFTDA